MPVPLHYHTAIYHNISQCITIYYKCMIIIIITIVITIIIIIIIIIRLLYNILITLNMTIYDNTVHTCTHAIGMHPKILSGLPHNNVHNDIILAHRAMASTCAEATASIAMSLRMSLIGSLSAHCTLRQCTAPEALSHTMSHACRALCILRPRNQHSGQCTHGMT